MKRFCLMMTMIVLLSIPCAYAHAPGTRLGMEALCLMADGTENRFISPVSLAYALSLAAQGAKGDTLESILDALDITSVEEMAALNRPLSEAGLKWANAAFVRPKLVIEKEYKAAIEKLFDAQMFEIKTNAAKKINAWVRKNTDGLIDDLVRDPLDETIMMCLVNAVCMDAKWRIPFKEYATCEDTFHAPDGDVQTDFMRNEFYADYGKANGTQFLRLEYRDCGLSMLLALPPEGDVQAALEGMKVQGLDYFDFNKGNVKVDLKLPKLDISVDNTFSDALKALGMGTPFSENADFSGISKTPLFVSDVIQKVRVQVDEEGTRAAAATSVIMAEGAMRVKEEIIPVRFDRPFVMVIAEETTGSVCFAGVVANPTA